MDNLECSHETAVAVDPSNEQNINKIDNAWKNIFDTLDRKMLESDGVDEAVTHEQVQENNDNNPDIVSSHPVIEFVPSHNYRLFEDSVGVDHTEDRTVTMESIMERENDLFKELSTVEHSALNYFKNYWTNLDKDSEPVAASSAAPLSKPTEIVSETIENNEDSIGADFITTADSTILKCPSVELIMERKDNLFKKLTEIEHNMLNYFKNFRTKVKVHSESVAATTAVALTKKTESDSKIDIDNGSYVDVHPDRAQAVVQETLESTEKIAPSFGEDYEGGDYCSRNRGDNWSENNDEFTTLSPMVMNGHHNHDDNGDEKYCNEERYYTESSVDDSLEQFEMSNGEKYLEIDFHHYAFSSTIEKPNKRDHHQKSKLYYYFADDDQYESMDEEHPCSENLWEPLDNSREQYETINKTCKTKKRMRYQQKVTRRSDYADDNHSSNQNLNEDHGQCYYSFDDGGQQLIDKKPKKIKKCNEKCRRLTENIN